MKLPDSIPLGRATTGTEKDFFERAEGNPCVGCSAPCCRAFWIPYPTPSTYMDLDAMLYMLGFPTTQMILSSNGSWKVMIEQNCRFFDLETNLCTIYGTSRRPKTCDFFNPYQCWHKRNFHDTGNPSEIILIDVGALEAILAHIYFDEAGTIIDIPEWDVLQELARQNKSGSEIAST